jgi:hypothetical protein
VLAVTYKNVGLRKRCKDAQGNRKRATVGLVLKDSSDSADCSILLQSTFLIIRFTNRPPTSGLTERSQNILPAVDALCVNLLFLLGKLQCLMGGGLIEM